MGIVVGSSKLGLGVGEAGFNDGAVVEMEVGAVEVDGLLVDGVAEGVVGVLELGEYDGNLVEGDDVGMQLGFTELGLLVVGDNEGTPLGGFVIA